MDPAPLHVLVVEDSILESTLLDELLLRRAPGGREISLSHAGTLSEALECLERTRVDAVLLDLGLPDSDGLETISRLRAADGDVPIVVRTALDDEHIGLEAIRAGAFEFLVKGHADGPTIARSLRYAVEQRLATDALRRSEARFRALIENSTDAIGIVDADGIIQFISRGIGDILGYKAESMCESNPFSFVHPEDVAIARAAFQACLDTPRTVHRVRVRARHADGSYRVIAAVVVNRLDDNATNGIVANFRDVTEEVALARQLAQQRAELEAFFEHAPLSLAILDGDLRYRTVNDTLAKLNRILPAEHVGRRPDEVISAQLAATVMPLLRQALHDGKLERTELEGRVRDGEEAHVAALSAFSFIEPVTCTPRLAVILEDVTELRHAQQQLRDQLELQSNLRRGAEALLNTLNVTEVAERVVGVCTNGFGVEGAWVGAARDDGELEPLAAVRDPHFHSLPWPRSDAQDELRPTEVAMTTRRSVVCNDIAQDSAHARFLDTAKKVGAQSCMALPLISRERVFGAMAVYSKQLNYFTPSRVQALETFAHHAASALENARLYETLARELSERGRLEEQFRQAQKMEAVGRLAGGVAHDFNNLLTAMIGYTELVKDSMPPNGQAVSDLNEVLTAAHRAAALTRQLLAFGRRQLLMPEVLSLGAVVRGMERMLQPLLGEDIDLVITEAAEVPPVCADRGQLEQVVMNLAVNARDAMAGGGRLSIDIAFASAPEPAAPQDRWVALVVSDSGCGMDHETLSKIFEPFFTTKERGKGTGLGLSTVYGIVRQSGGHISVQSDPGRGTTFRILFKAADENSASSRGGNVAAAGKA